MDDVFTPGTSICSDDMHIQKCKSDGTYGSATSCDPQNQGRI